MNSIIRWIQISLLYSVVFLMAVSYHPAVVGASRSVGLESGTLLSRYIFILFVALFAVSITRMPRIRAKFLLKSSVWLFVILIVGLIVSAVYNNQGMLLDLRSIAIILASILIGWASDLSHRQLSICLFIFGFTALFSGLSQVFSNIGGFVIEDQYLVDSKNSLGAMLATAELAFLFLWKSLKNKPLRLISFFCAIIGLMVIVTIRARASLLAVLIVAAVYIYYISKNKRTTVLTFITVAVVFSALILIPSDISQYLYNSIFSGTQGEDVSSGRVGVYEAALHYLSQNTLLGNVENNHHLPWIHNYVLLIVYEYGLLFSWPILTLYFYILFHSINYLIRTTVGFPYIGYSIILVPYVISLLEPTFPFGPGTVTVTNFILLGIAERTRCLQEKG